MVPTLTMLGRFSAATRGAAIPWFETTLVTLNSMAGQNPEVTSIPPDSLNRLLLRLQPTARMFPIWKKYGLAGTFERALRRLIPAGKQAFERPIPNQVKFTPQKLRPSSTLCNQFEEEVQ